MKRRPGGGESTFEQSFGPIQVAARREDTGRYQIALTTFDLGHFGKAGYLFSDTTPVRIDGDPYCDVEAPGDLWMLAERVGPRWWVITNHLH